MSARMMIGMDEQSSHAGITGTVIQHVEMEGVQLGVAACDSVRLFCL